MTAEDKHSKKEAEPPPQPALTGEIYVAQGVKPWVRIPSLSPFPSPAGRGVPKAG